jgi:hypothetical protein
MVTFSELRYSVALAKGKEQDKIMEEVLSWDGIDENWEDETTFNNILKLATGL